MPFPRSTRSDMEKPGRMRCTPADSPKVGGHPGIPCRKGQAPSLRGGACEFAQSCGERGDSCAARRGRRALRGLRIRLTGCFGSVLLRGTPRTAFPTGLVRIRRRLNQVADVCCRPSRTPPPTRPLRVPHFLPPAGEGGIRRSPARRMTEEGEPDRLQTVQSFAYFPPLRSFPHRGSVTFSLSGRPCGRHPPPLGEGRGEGALDERHVRQIRSRLIVGGGVQPVAGSAAGAKRHALRPAKSPSPWSPACWTRNRAFDNTASRPDAQRRWGGMLFS